MNILGYNLKIRQQMLVFFLIFAIVPSLLITVFTQTTNNRTVTESKNELSSLQIKTLAGIASQYSNIVNNWVGQNSKTVNIISQDPLIRENLLLLNNYSQRYNAIEKINSLFSTWVDSSSAIQEMILLNYTNGDVLISKSSYGIDNTTTNKFSSNYFIGAKANQGLNISTDRVYFEQTYLSTTTNSLVMDFSKVLRPTSSNSTEPTEILVAEINPTSLFNLIAPRDADGKPSNTFYNTIGLGQTGEIFLVNMHGLAISRSRFDVSDTNFILHQSFTSIPAFEKAINQGYVNSMMLNYLGNKVYGVFTYLGTNTVSTDLRSSYLINQLSYNLPWVLVVEIDVSEVLAPVTMIQNQQSNSLVYISGMILVLGIIVTAISLFISNSFSKPIVKLSATSKKLSEGDLTINIESTNKKDEIGELENSFEKMIDFIKSPIKSISTIAKLLASSAQEMASSSEEVNASSEEMSSISQQISKGAQNQTEQLSGAINDVQNIKNQFSEKLKNITIASELIEAISSQVNMLSLNASIEAARAGEYGRGFSVVADNIRRLADDTKSSVEKVTSIINDLTTTMNSGMEKISTSVTNVIAVAEETATGAEEASAATEEQAATMQELSASAQELAKISVELEEIVFKFKIE